MYTYSYRKKHNLVTFFTTLVLGIGGTCLLLIILSYIDFNKYTVGEFSSSDISALESNYFIMGLHDQPRAVLFDKYGRILHNWSMNLNKGHWRTPELFENGDIIIVTDSKSVTRLDRDSKIIWKVDGWYHHMTLTENGITYALRNKKWKSPESKGHPPLLDNLIVKISSSGQILEEYSIFDMLYRSIPKSKLQAIISHFQSKYKLRGKDNTPLDVLHTNSLVIAEHDFNGVWNKGDVLISMRNLSAIAVLDLKNRSVKLYMESPYFAKQHSAKILRDNSILLFNNGNRQKNEVYENLSKSSSILIIDPLTKNILWEYNGKLASKHFPKKYPEERTFFSVTRSSVSYTDGGFLIFIFDKQHVFFVKDNEVIWSIEFSGEGEMPGSSFSVEAVQPKFFSTLEEVELEIFHFFDDLINFFGQD